MSIDIFPTGAAAKAGPWRRRAGLIAGGLATLAALLSALIWREARPAPLERAQAAALYAEPLTPPAGPLAVYHLGHSLVGRDMPAMLAQLAGAGHRYDSQLGWGTPLKAHWEPSIEINGFEDENAHPRYRDAKSALAGGGYDAVVLTEMVEIRDAIAYHASGTYLARWTAAARAGNSDVRVYLYETWPRIDDAEGWLDRLDRDLARYWEEAILFDALARTEPAQPIHVIPAGQVFARFARAVEARGDVDDLTGKEGLFRIEPDGTQDPIHLNDLGAYLVALTHYAVLYHRSPVGLPHRLRRADGSPADAPGAATTRLMQETVWQVVRAYPKTGLGR